MQNAGVLKRIFFFPCENVILKKILRDYRFKCSPTVSLIEQLTPRSNESTLQDLFLFCSIRGEAVKNTNEQITMTAGHKLHAHRYAKQSRARNL